MKKIIIFDFDGTLANSIALGLDVYNNMSEKFKSEKVKISEFESLRKMTYKSAMKYKKIRLSILPLMIIQVRKGMKERMNEVEPYAGIVEVLQKLHTNGYKMAVLTSNTKEIVEQFLERHNFPDFEFIWAEKNIFGKDKALKHIMKRHNLSAQEIIYVGDEPRDVIACNKVGIYVIGVSWGLGGRAGFHLAEPDLLINKPDELLTSLPSK